MEKAMLIVNPSSGKEKGKVYAEKARKALFRRYREVVVKETQKGGDATEFARQAAQERFDVVVAMGGDGTLNEVINGLAEQENRPAFSFIPLGTVNDLARSLGIPLRPDKAIKALETATKRTMDIGKIGDTYFMNVLAAGMIAEAVDKVSVEQKTRFGSVAYFAEGLKAFSRHELLDFEIKYDEGDWKGEAALVIASLTNSVGGMEQWAPEAEVDDGLIHVFIITKLGIIDAAKILPQIALGTLKKADGVMYFSTTTLEIDCTEPEVKVNVDGDPGDTFPIKIEVLKEHLEVLVPR
ncbi:diacylglycerol kinase family lipid kinase [Listeria booriae]|uniref:Diacylglycerol kinase n=1 Tax=Listeria booriae TaxID=1552123 RepID=A0A099W4Y7_9LIST|nr:diacylglycerol kinase family protein [Listeria booriae]KGL40829.1 diacylglycerol kinase [Listeria booriae]MBC1890922.1 diacylglycerol kinase family lipid kinase [Listeria booriae]MBC1897045.1 diacylglycerol kinase family lipid kinase [Listeria booriae]MBC2057357.1 diacylglycerol kinase family lipid kinase [Listeria booriae]STY42250.1 Diacylglycerol kinase [Listeria booriae]